MRARGEDRADPALTPTLSQKEREQKARLVPLGLGAVMLVVGALLLMTNLALLAAGHTAIKLVPGLAGQTAQQAVPRSLAAVLAGRFQAAYAQAIGSTMPLYPAAIRLRNQLDYSLFGFSSNPAIIVGRDGVLIERVYAEEYCSRDLARWRPGAVVWAGRIREMQDAQARRGKSFLYVLTPSKVALYPALLPPGFNCPSHAADRAGLLPEWLGLLRAAGVQLVDTTAVLRQAAPDYPFRLYPDGGTHWNAVGEALAQQAVLAGLNRVLPDRDITPSAFTWQMRPHPVRDSDDVDLARLMNLFQPVANGPVPMVTSQPDPLPAGDARPPRVVIIGGSFSHATLRALSDMPHPVHATEYEYWHSTTLRWRNGALDRGPGVDPAARDADLAAADVVIYEENEQLLSQPLHGQALWEFLGRRGHMP